MTALDRFRERECLVCGAIFRPKRATNTTFCTIECQSDFAPMASRFVRAGLLDGSLSIEDIRRHRHVDFRRGTRVSDKVIKERIMAAVRANGGVSPKLPTLTHLVGADNTKTGRLRKQLAEEGRLLHEGRKYMLVEDLWVKE